MRLKNEIIERFKRDFELDGNAEKSIIEYEGKIITFFNFSYPKKKINQISVEDMKKITDDNIQDFKFYCLKTLKNKETTINTKIAVLKTFFSYLETKGYIEKNPTSDITVMKTIKQLPKFLTTEECVRLMEAPKGCFAIRDRAILSLYLNTGMRLNELVELDLDHIKDDKVYIMKGKGNKERHVKLNKDCIYFLGEYLKTRNNRVSINALFLSNRNNRIDERTVQETVKSYLKDIGRPELSVHKLRHTFATRLIGKDVSIKVIQRLMGHARLSTTEIYTHVADRYADDAVENLNF